MTKPTIAVFTSTRAEYGLLRPVIRALDASPDLAVHVIVSGAHLSATHGHTVDEIDADGIAIGSRVPTLSPEGSPAEALAATIVGVSQAIRAKRPATLLLLGDRYEALGAAMAATLERVPIAHLHGGEATYGALDEGIRHAITKLAHLHLVASAEFAKRVLQLGESPERVHVVGAPGLDEVASLAVMDRPELVASLGWDPGEKFIVLTYHPTTLRPGAAAHEISEVIAGATQSGLSVLATAPNADPEAEDINRLMSAAATTDPRRFHLVKSLGRRRYLSAIRLAAAVVGNSSSGIIEAPFVGTPTVNIGPRQDGRPRASTIRDVPPARQAVAQAIVEVSTAPRPTSEASLYGDGAATPRILDAIRSMDQDLMKVFHDLDVTGREL